MHLIAGLRTVDATQVPALARGAHLTPTDSGWLVGLVLAAGDRRLLASHMVPHERPRGSGTELRERIDALSARLARTPGTGTMARHHVCAAARTLEASLRAHDHADDIALSARQLSIALEMLGSDLARPTYVSEVALACSVSEGHFRRAFRTCTGLSPQQWRQEQRVQFCRGKLVETDQPLLVIARDAGFVAQSHFSRVFTQLTGMSPSEWRRMFRPSIRVGSWT